MLRALSIILLCIGAAILYGVIHDQFTIRLSLEYFTIVHPQILPVGTSPTVLALAWGVIATWWVGLILGVILSIGCCGGKRPTLSAKEMVRPILILLLVMAGGAFLSGCTGYFLASRHIVGPGSEIAEVIPPDRIPRLIAAWFTHLASYGLGFIGAVVLSIRAWIRREILEKTSILPPI
jgi:glycerol uptake facilitator-like aquaporin